MNRSHRSSAERAEFRTQAAAAHVDTPAEEAMRSLLVDMGVPHFSQVSLDTKARGEIADFFIPRNATIIEVDGPEHNKGPDARRDRRLWKEHGILTLRITNKEILTHPEKVRGKLMKALGWS